MLVGVVGGKLQGVEAAYLARKAGWEVRIVDKKTGVPASGLCDSFVQADVNDENKLDRALGDVDFIVPALEDDNALASLSHWSRKTGVPLAFDPQAYAVSSSKLRSAEMFKKIGLPIPAVWPQCRFPVLAKPGRGSGSKGVRIFEDLESMQDWFSPNFPPPDWVLEEFLDGSQHSLEVVGRPGNYRLLQVTDLYVDQDFDCKRVIAPTNLPQNLTAEFEGLSQTIAEAINLHGIMDVEAIYTRGEFKVLEIDARLPSQTPTAVYWSTHRNMLRLLGDLFASPVNETSPAGNMLRGTVYEHIHACGDILKACGEGIMTQGGPLKLQSDFFGADEALTNYVPGHDQWVATLIFSGTNRRRAREKRNRSIAEIAKRFKIKEVIDPQPAVGSIIRKSCH
ncbi:MAG: 3-methylornithine--L-lysine ligase PylC [bacterium]|nr:3-methylornithine--L-lysine ligase PylC [bacterium]